MQSYTFLRKKVKQYNKTCLKPSEIHQKKADFQRFKHKNSIYGDIVLTLTCFSFAKNRKMFNFVANLVRSMLRG